MRQAFPSIIFNRTGLGRHAQSCVRMLATRAYHPQPILNFDDAEYPIGLKSPSRLHPWQQQAW
ncbi:MAG: hypothetical protein AB1861_24465 [Cyanobacteriota bacterium]